ncbi:protein toll-like [Zophobas morio]|uniref:protein toll-like n=1 Tax=Zophobas morio TaxID=2755281 RepID=UPI00308365E6
MNNACLILILLFCLKPAASTIECNHNDNCLCLPSVQEVEFQCPSNFDDVSEFVIHVKDNIEILIDCASNLKKFNVNLLPNITIDKIERFRMRFCPLPTNGFKEVLDHFSLKEVKFLQFGSSNLSNVTLTKEYFRGLEFLDSLQLNADGLVDMEEDVFANTPNLTSLEMQLNRVSLKEGLFRYTPMLKSLDLSENKIQSIPGGLFKGLDKLELLHLWSNNLTQIDDLTFQGLTNLKSLELSANKIENISEGAFKSLMNLSRVNLSQNQLKSVLADPFSHNTKLELIAMRGNPNLKLQDYAFSNLPVVKDIDLTNCKLDDIPKSVFENSPNIKELKLGRNKLKGLPEGLFEGLRTLEELYLDNNHIETVGKSFASLKKLKILHLQNNRIERIGVDDFKDLTDLTEIFLQKNRIVTIHNRAFDNNAELKKIDLSHNFYTGEYNAHFTSLDNVVNIETINLSHNRITQIGDVITLYNKVRLRSLDLSSNQITNITLSHLIPLAPKLSINLENNKITSVDFKHLDVMTENVKDAYSAREQSQTVIFLGNNPVDCDCYNLNLVKYFQDDLDPKIKVMFDIRTENYCANPPELQDVPIKMVPQSLLLCSFEKIDEEDFCPDNCSCSWRPFDTSLILDCSNKKMAQFPQIESLQMVKLQFNQTEVHLEGNELSGLDANLTGYENVTRLYLSDNKIEKVEWLPSQLKVVHLDNNKIKHLDYRVFEKLNGSYLVNMTLDHNPWRCECEAVNFTNFLRQHSKVIDNRDILCYNTSRRLIHLNKNDLCHELRIANIILPILIIGLLLTTLLVLYYRYQEPIKIWLYSRNLCLCWVTEEELDKDKDYDAFVSYSHKDEDFIIQNLLPVLEGGSTPYKLCLHYRHFIPGEMISTQITNSVLNSRRTLVVLSPNFLESVWGKMEFRTAHTHAMTEGRARVIIVLYGDVDVEKLDDELKAYLKTNTYVKWGDPYFWNKLKYALPHSKRKSCNNNQKIANVMNCIDDKFNLVAPVTPSPGTTPPVLNLDPSILKKHPLNFVHSHELDTPPAEAGTLLISTGL